MSSNLHDPKAAQPEGQEQSGLDPEELRAEQADDLPNRDAMSIISVGGLEGGLPPTGILDGILDTNLPVERYPVDELPIRIMPPDITPPVIEPPVLEPPADSLPVEPPVDGDPVSVPDPVDASTDVGVEA
ncbi:MAG TPA: hypothetical protein VFH48_46270 [Chloroflexota bacterium]|nr:hypothetical protein [Chloroflexota bacterium]